MMGKFCGRDCKRLCRHCAAFFPQILLGRQPLRYSGRSLSSFSRWPPGSAERALKGVSVEASNDARAEPVFQTKMELGKNKKLA